LTEISKILPGQVDKVQSKEYYPSTRPLGQNKLKTWYLWKYLVIMKMSDFWKRSCEVLFDCL